jgi:amino acid transporter
MSAGRARIRQEDIVYGEVHYLPAWVFGLLASLVVLFATLYFVVRSAKALAAAIAMLVGLAIVILALFFFSRLTFIITREEIDFGFAAPFRKAFSRQDLESCEPYELKFSNYGGYGWRPGRDGTTALNTRNGPGVKMVFTGAKRPVVVSVDNPEAICDMLRPHIRPQV